MSAIAPMECVEFVERVNDYLEGALAEPDRARLEAHLSICPYCAEYLEQLRVVRDRAGAVTDVDIAPRVRKDLLEVFRRWNDER